MKLVVATDKPSIRRSWASAITVVMALFPTKKEAGRPRFGLNHILKVKAGEDLGVYVVFSRCSIHSVFTERTIPVILAFMQKLSHASI